MAVQQLSLLPLVAAEDSTESSSAGGAEEWRDHGHLVSCDNWLNINLREDGDKFWRMPECYISGSTIKFLTSNEMINVVQEEAAKGHG